MLFTLQGIGRVRTHHSNGSTSYLKIAYYILSKPSVILYKIYIEFKINKYMNFIKFIKKKFIYNQKFIYSNWFKLNYVLYYISK